VLSALRQGRPRRGRRYASQRSLAVLVCNPELLHIDCRTVEQMRLVNRLCRLVELAD
jgi:hypothetical protein